MSIKKNHIHIPVRFERAIALHLLKNKLLENNPTLNPPLILGIDGLPGTGKTFQCQKVIEKLGYHEILISGGELESKNAGEPAELIRERYLKANRILATKKVKGVVLLFNDIETGIGDWGGGTQYTVNRQAVFGELMHIVDYPTSVGGVETRRIPIILTGNDFSKLYEPLTRAGRFESFTWTPTLDETIETAKNILNFLDPKELEDIIYALIEEYKKKDCDVIPTSFFSHFKTLLLNDVLWNLYVSNPHILDYDNNTKLDFDKYFANVKFDYTELKEKALKLLTSNYFEEQLRGYTKSKDKDREESASNNIFKINFDRKIING